MPPKKLPSDTFWRKATYIASNDNTFTALYRAFGVFSFMALIGIMTWMGQDALTTQKQQTADIREARDDIKALKSDIGEIKGTLTMMDRRDTRLVDHINANDTRITKLEVKMELAMAKR